MLASVNVVCFAVGALISRSVKKTAIEEGVQRRTEAREQLRIRDELRFAREVQISMLPEAPPQLEWADVAGVSLPATEVGGDYYDYFVVDGRLAIVCGDVAGHGLASGITLSALAQRIHAAARPTPRSRLRPRPAAGSRHAEQPAADDGHDFGPAPRSRNASRHDRVRRSSAAAPRPRRRRATRNSIELFAPPLGARLGAIVPQRVVPFASGDTFVLHSDGIYETVNASGDEYGLDRLARIVAACDGTAEEIRDAVLRDVEEFRGNEPQQDDVTLVVVKNQRNRSYCLFCIHAGTVDVFPLFAFSACLSAVTSCLRIVPRMRWSAAVARSSEVLAVVIAVERDHEAIDAERDHASEVAILGGEIVLAEVRDRIEQLAVVEVETLVLIEDVRPPPACSRPESRCRRSDRCRR